MELPLLIEVETVAKASQGSSHSGSKNERSIENSASELRGVDRNTATAGWKSLSSIESTILPVCGDFHLQFLYPVPWGVKVLKQELA